jgi:hypothetical protein
MFDGAHHASIDRDHNTKGVKGNLLDAVIKVKK